MREIKFRAWKDGKCYYLDIDLISPYDGWTDYSADAVIEQYTGLHDRNGVEIYEGDIVKLGERNHEVNIDCMGVSFGSMYIADNEDMHKRAEVVGNIHEGWRETL